MKILLLLSSGLVMLFTASIVPADYVYFKYGSGHPYRHGHHPYGHRGAHLTIPLYPNYSHRHSVIREIEKPIVYIERPLETQPSTPPAARAPEDFWYYCKKPAGYYPQIERCPDGWMQVVPHKPPGESQ